MSILSNPYQVLTLLNLKENEMGRWCTYIVECSDLKKTLYTGTTNNIRRRLDQHNTGKGAKYTKGRAPIVLMAMFYRKNRSEACILECKIKRMCRRTKFKVISEYRILKEYFGEELE